MLKDPYKDVGSAALEVVTNNYTSPYTPEIYCLQNFDRCATKHIKAFTMLRWTDLKFVAALRKGPALDPGFSIRSLILEIEVFLCQQ